MMKLLDQKIDEGPVSIYGRASAIGSPIVKILILNDYAIAQGGAERLTFALRDQMRRLGHDARVFATRAGATRRTPADYECFGTTGAVGTLSQTVNVSAFARLRQVLREFQPDVVHVRMFLTQLSPFILPLLRSVPTVSHVVWYRPICPTGTRLLPSGAPCRERAGIACFRNNCVPLHRWLPLQLQRLLWERWRGVFDAVVANGEPLRRALEEAGISPVRVISNGVTDMGLAPPLEGPRIVACAARLVREKGVDILIDAFAGLADAFPDARLVIAGDGPERRTLEAQARVLGVGGRVEFLGHVLPEEMESRLCSAWVQVVPSVWAEPFGLVAAEAMMRGTCVIASRSGGLMEIVQDGVTGLLCEPGDRSALQECLGMVLRDPALPMAMGEAGRRRALEHFTLERQCQSFLDLYSELLASQRQDMKLL